MKVQAWVLRVTLHFNGIRTFAMDLDFEFELFFGTIGAISITLGAISITLGVTATTVSLDIRLWY